jgi:HK97 family phage major capsid protein
MEKFDGGAELTVEDRKKFDDADEALTRDKGDLDRLLRSRKVDEGIRDMASVRGRSEDEQLAGEDGYKRAYEKWFRSNPMAGPGGMLNPEEMRMLSTGEQRTVESPLSTSPGSGVDGSAGFLIPQAFWDNLVIRLRDYGGLMELCNTIETSTGAPMPWPTNDPTNTLGKYLTENTQLVGTQSSGQPAISFGQGMMHAWFITSDVVLASYAIINDSAFSVDSFVTDRCGERIGRKIAAELHAGLGAVSQAMTGLDPSLSAFAQVNTTGGQVDAQPKGGYYQPLAGETVFNLQHPSTATAALGLGVPSWQSMINLTKSVDPAYRKAGNCRFVMNDATEGKIRSLTDGFGHPLWQPNVQVGPATGALATVEGFPVTIDQNAAAVSTSASTAGGVLFGDFKRAMNIRMVRQSGTMRLTERYADFLQVGYIQYVRLDSVPNDLHAVVEYKTNTS